MIDTKTDKDRPFDRRTDQTEMERVRVKLKSITIKTKGHVFKIYQVSPMMLSTVQVQSVLLIGAKGMRPALALPLREMIS